MQTPSFPTFASSRKTNSPAFQLIYNILVETYPKMKRLSKELILENTLTLDEYYEWLYTNKISCCPKPWCWYIKNGEFIADEMRGQVLGVTRKNNYPLFRMMDKWDWRSCDDVEVPCNHEIVVVNIEPLFEERAYIYGAELDSDTDTDEEDVVEPIKKPAVGTVLKLNITTDEGEDLESLIERMIEKSVHIKLNK